MSKTIRQIADEIGVSKQTVYKRFKGKLYTVCAPYAHTEQGVLYIEEQGETLIKQDFLEDNRSIGAHTYAHTERSNGAVQEQSQSGEIIAVLQTTIDTLQGQLGVKDQQIERLHTELEKEREHSREKDRQLLDVLSRLADGQAALAAGHAAEKKKELADKLIEGQQLMSGDVSEEMEDAEDAPDKKRLGWLYRLFSR